MLHYFITFLNIDIIIISAAKRYFKIDQQIARILGNTVKVFQIPFPFYVTQILNPFY